MPYSDWKTITNITVGPQIPGNSSVPIPNNYLSQKGPSGSYITSYKITVTFYLWYAATTSKPNDRYSTVAQLRGWDGSNLGILEHGPQTSGSETYSGQVDIASPSQLVYLGNVTRTNPNASYWDEVRPEWAIPDIESGKGFELEIPTVDYSGPAGAGRNSCNIKIEIQEWQPRPIPAVPSNVVLSPTNIARGSYATLTWNSQTNVDSYKIYIDGSYSTSTTSTSAYIGSNLSVGNHTISVSASNESGESSKSTAATLTVRTPATAPPSFYINGSSATTCYIGSNTATLPPLVVTWNSTGATSYRVRQGSTVLASGITNLSYTLPKSVVSGTIYVDALNSSGDITSGSYYINLYTVTGSAPSSLYTRQSSSGASLSQDTLVNYNLYLNWSTVAPPVTGSTIKYRIEYAQSGTTSGLTNWVVYDTVSNAYIDSFPTLSKITRGNYVQFRVVTIVTVGNNGTSESVATTSTRIRVSTGPAKAMNLSVRNDSSTGILYNAETSAYLSWSFTDNTASTGVSFSIQFSDNGGSSWSSLVTGLAITTRNYSQDVSSMTRGQIRLYKIITYDALGDYTESTDGNTFLVTRNTLPTVSSIIATMPETTTGNPTVSWALTTVKDPLESNYSNTSYVILAAYGGKTFEIARARFDISSNGTANGSYNFNNAGARTALGLTADSLNTNVTLQVYLIDESFGVNTATTTSSSFLVDYRIPPSLTGNVTITGLVAGKTYINNGNSTGVSLSWPAAIGSSPSSSITYEIHRSVSGGIYQFVTNGQTATTKSGNIIPLGNTDQEFIFRVRAYDSFTTKYSAYIYSASNTYYSARFVAASAKLDFAGRDISSSSKINVSISSPDTGGSTTFKNLNTITVGAEYSLNPSLSPAYDFGLKIPVTATSESFSPIIVSKTGFLADQPYYVRGYIETTAAGASPIRTYTSISYIAPSYGTVSIRKTKVGINIGDLKPYGQALVVAGSSQAYNELISLRPSSYGPSTDGAFIGFYRSLTGNVQSIIGVNGAGTWRFGTDTNGVLSFSNFSISNAGDITANNINASSINGVLMLAGGTMTGPISTMDLIPKTNNLYNLGSTTNRYSSLFTNTINTTYLASSLIPTPGGVYNVGTPTYLMSYVYANYVNTNYLNAKSIVSNLVPNVTNTYEIGASTYRFNTGYFSTVNTLSLWAVNVGSHLVPNVTNVYNIGSLTYRFNQIHSNSAYINTIYGDTFNGKCNSSTYANQFDSNRTITLTGSVTGSAVWNGAGNLTIATSGGGATISPYTGTPSAPTTYGSAGSNANYSRGDHSHPAQTTINSATYATYATSANSVSWSNVSGKPSIPSIAYGTLSGMSGYSASTIYYGGFSYTPSITATIYYTGSVSQAALANSSVLIQSKGTTSATIYAYPGGAASYSVDWIAIGT